jgi:hypothetical protein
MTQRMARMVAAALGCLLFVPIANAPASACACCSNRGSRTVATVTLDPQRMVQIDQMVFGKTAQLYVGESDGEQTLVDGFGSGFTLDVERQKKRIVFTFRNKQGVTGTATFVMPKNISIFEVDPHGGGRGCTEATHFTNWTLQLRRPKGQTIFFGALESGTP